MAPGGPPGGEHYSSSERAPTKRITAANRGRGGKFKKFTRGGGKHFSRDLRPLDSDGNEIRGDNDDESSEKESTEDESSSDEEDEKPQTQMTREERRQAAKAKKEAAKAKKKGVPQPGDMPSEESSDEESLDDMPANPNHSKAARTQASAAPATVEETAEGMAKLTVAAGKKGAAKPLEQLSRRERDAVQAQQARERYQKLHEAGKTDEAKADLARLALIREKREAENARKKAEKDEIEEANRAKKAEIETREAKRREAALGPSASAKGKGKAKK